MPSSHKLGDDNLVELGNESGETIKQVEKCLFEVFEQLAPEVRAGHYILSSVDLKAGLYYAPLFNFSHTVLSKIGLDPKKELLRKIRNTFLVGIDPTGFLREVCRSIRQNSNHDRDLFFIGVRENGDILPNPLCFAPNKNGSPIDTSIKQTIDNYQKVGERIHQRLSRLRVALNLSQQARCFLIIRPEKVFRGSYRSEKLDIMQIGVIFLSDPQTEIDDGLAMQYHQIAQISSFATLSLLYERERYFEKAVRQSMQGSLVKHGDYSDIKEQFDILQDLSESKRWNIPTIQGHDPSLASNGRNKRFSWYRMTNFKLSSLRDLLTFTEGFEAYEIATLMRSSYGHLRHIYWGEPLKIEQHQIQPSLLVPLAIAISVTKESIDTIKLKANDIKQNQPVEFTRGVDVFSIVDLRKFQNVLEAIENRAEIEIRVKCEKSERPIYIKATDPVSMLEVLKSSINSTLRQSDKSYWYPRIKEGRIHGDAHLGNLLIDASVPEDPLIISIDPKKVDTKKIEKQCPKSVAGCDSSAISQEIERIEWDLAYDVAKLMFSTSCCFGPVYHHGFLMQRGKSKKVFNVTKSDEEGLKKLGATGGLSSSKIVKIGAPVSRYAWRDHSNAAQSVLSEYIGHLSQSMPDKRGEIFQTSINVSLIRLWIFTVRHLLSTIGKSFPMEMEPAIVMYLLATAFIKRGTEKIEKIVDSELERIESQQTLMDLFTWKS